jgi:nucleotide-binding universal stress UspA family protein
VGPVVVGTDGSAGSEEAVRTAFEEAARRRAGLVAVHSWIDLSSGPQRYRPLDPEVVERSAREVVAGQLGVYADKYPEVTVQQVVTADRPVRHLVNYSERAQLLVVGSRGRGGFGGLLLGSTSQALVYHARCPVLVVRACAEGAPRAC